MINLTILIEVLVGIALFLLINYLTYYLTENDKLPDWLDYKPFNCRKCLFTWASLMVFGVIGLITSFTYPYVFGFGIGLSILNAIALIYNDKKQFI